jgi:hypothetical protein
LGLRQAFSFPQSLDLVADNALRVSYEIEVERSVRGGMHDSHGL